MEQISLYAFEAAFVTLALATMLYLLYLAVRSRDVAAYAAIFGWLGCGLLGLSVIFRAVAAGRLPFINMYEYSIGFSWGIALAGMVVQQRFKIKTLGAFVLPVVLVLLAYAAAQPKAITPLVPALQNNLLLPLHVSVAIVASGVFGVACGSSVMYLLQGKENRIRSLPSRKVLDDISYRAVLIGFPFLALMMLLGSYWGYVAWSRYWGWDPKETSALVACFIYAAYLHTRGQRAWRGNRGAILLIAGFLMMAFTFFGVNLLLPGLHSYAGA